MTDPHTNTKTSNGLVERVARAMQPSLFGSPDSRVGPATLRERERHRAMALRAIEASGADRLEHLERALTEQTLLVDRLCTAVDQAAEDVGHESIDDLLKLIGPQNDRCIELLGGRGALNQSGNGGGNTRN